MTIPTRFIEREEFNGLMRLEGNVFPLFKLVAIPFNPPTPDHPNGPVDYGNYKAIRVLMLNVIEPRLYRDENGIVFVVLPNFDVVTYDIAADAHPIHDAWCYRFSPYNWDDNDHLGQAVYLFSDDTIPAFNLDDVDTH
jgi:hypothetical protein